MRDIPAPKLEELKDAYPGLAVAFADGQGRWADSQAVAAQLAYYKLTGATIFLAYAEVPRI